MAVPNPSQSPVYSHPNAEIELIQHSPNPALINPEP